jgi:multidrug resistance efflux pump
LGGKITKLFVKENSNVKQNQVMAYIEATANHDHILKLSATLDELETEVNDGIYDYLDDFGKTKTANLGELQPDYQQFEQSLTKLQSLTTNGFYGQKRKILQQELDNSRYLSVKLKEQLTIYNRDYQLAQKDFDAHQRLAKRGVISQIELAREESKMLSKQLPLKQVESSIMTNNAEQSAKSKELLDLDRSLFEQKSFTSEALKTLISAVNAWKSKYIVTAPTDGKVFFLNTLQENQVVAVNQELFYVGMGKPNDFIGEMKIPQDNFGKLKIGNRVMIRFNGYPSEEYGTVMGLVQGISQIPDKDNTYLVRVKLSSGLKTDYGKTLAFRNGMLASADIITDDQTLAEKILYQFRRALQR